MSFNAYSELNLKDVKAQASSKYKFTQSQIGGEKYHSKLCLFCCVSIYVK